MVDEVVMGFGCIGRMFVMDDWVVVLDVFILLKVLMNGVMGVVVFLVGLCIVFVFVCGGWIFVYGEI